MSIAWVDAPSGLAGDMMLGALVAAGLPLRVLEKVVVQLGLEGQVRLKSRRVAKGAIVGTKVDVLVGDQPHPHDHPHEHPPVHFHTDDPHHAHRTLPDVIEILRGARELPHEALADAVRAFQVRDSQTVARDGLCRRRPQQQGDIAPRQRQAPAHVAADAARAGHDHANATISRHAAFAPLAPRCAPRLRTCYVARRPAADKRVRTL